MLLAALLRCVLASIELRILRKFQIRLAVANSRPIRPAPAEASSLLLRAALRGRSSSRIALNDHVAEILSGRLATTSVDVLMMIFYLIVMWRFNRTLTVVAAVFAAMNFTLLRAIAPRRIEGSIQLSMTQGRLAGVGIAGLQTIRTLKASGLEPDFFARWAGFFANFSNCQQGLSAVNYYLAVLPPLLMSLMTLVFWRWAASKSCMEP